MSAPISGQQRPAGAGPHGMRHFLGNSLGTGRALFRLAVAVPFFLAAGLHLSAVFKIFAALPIVYTHLRFGRLAGILASATNMAIVWLVTGRSDAAWFFVLAVILGASLAECVKLKLRLEWTVLTSMLLMFLASVMLLVSYSHKIHKGPLEVVETFISGEIDEFARNAEKYKASSSVSSQDLDKVLIDPEMTKRNLIEASPSIITISLLVLVAANILLMLRLNLHGVRTMLGLQPEFFRAWKAPDYMVWPTLAAGFVLVLEIRGVTDIALNLFRVLMAVYAIQGLAIINALFDTWGIKGFLRPLGYVMAVTFLLPLVVSLGFFDLWFNFREKFKTQ